MSKDTPPAADQRRRDQMLIEAGLALASELDLDAVLRRIVELAVAITDARYGALGVMDESGLRIERFITHGISDEVRARIGDPPVGHGILGLLIADQGPVRVADIGKDPRAFGFPSHHPEMHSFLGAPVRALGQVFGNLYLTEKQGADAFTEDDEAALVVLATQAGVAVENARLAAEREAAQAQRRRLEMLEERERIAKELHDGVIQSLFAVGIGLQGAAASAADDATAHRIEGAVDEIDRAIRDLRNYIFGLRPGILADRQLDQALQELVREFGERTGVPTRTDIDPHAAAELASRAADVVQLTREILSNVERHAEARTCRVTLSSSVDGAMLEIVDDGVGFDVDAPLDGMGLRNLRTRVEAMGGSLVILSEAGGGTSVRAELPR